jgi:hypothetical protein
MAAKKKARKTTTKMNKSEFVRSLAESVPAKQVVAEAAKLGMKLDEKYVYNVRSADRQKGGAPGRRAAVGRAIRGRRTHGENGILEDRLRTAIAEVGLARAREVFAEVESAFAGT